VREEAGRGAMETAAALSWGWPGGRHPGPGQGARIAAVLCRRGFVASSPCA